MDQAGLRPVNKEVLALMTGTLAGALSRESRIELSHMADQRWKRCPPSIRTVPFDPLLRHLNKDEFSLHHRNDSTETRKMRRRRAFALTHQIHTHQQATKHHND